MAAERAHYERAIAAAPHDHRLHHAFAVWLDRNGWAGAAMRHYGEAVRLAPANAQYAYDAGMLALEKGLEEEARPILELSARALPEDANVHQLLGLVARTLDDMPAAIKALATAARLAPADARIAHGHALAVSESGASALSLFDRARQLAPADATVLLGRAVAQFADGQGDAAKADLDLVLQHNPGWVQGHATLARLRWMSGERDLFVASFERALAAHPQTTALWGELVITLIHANAFEEALRAIARGRAAAGAHLVFDVNEAVCHSELGDHERADALFDALPPLDDMGVNVRRARHFLRRGRPDQAAALAEPLTGRPDASFIWPYLSVAWRQLGDERWQWLEGNETLVGVYDLPVADLAPLADRLRALHLASHQPLDQSLRGGTQTDGILLRRTEPEIRALRAMIIETVRSHVDQLSPRDPAHPTLGPARDRLRFAGSWSVRLGRQAHHANHVHPEGWFSSAFYVSLPESMGGEDSKAGWLTLGAPQAELGLDLAPFRTIEPKAGRLVLFPSTMWHGTIPFEAGERLTVAFDIALPRS